MKRANITTSATLILTAAMSTFVAGCGANVRLTNRPTNLLVIGNSIALHPPEADLQWVGNWGMAASAEDKDFVHQSATALGLPVFAINAAILEGMPEGAASSMSEIMQQAQPHLNSHTIVVIELGDNAWNTPQDEFKSAYDTLLTNVQVRQRLICIGTFWYKGYVDRLIQAECAAHGGTYAFIGDIQPDPNNTDWSTQLFANPGVQGHPHDWSHAQIAARVVKAIQSHNVQ